MGLTMAEAYPDESPCWFALTVKPQHERAATQQLTAHSLEAYLPVYRSERRWSDRVKTIELPLLPRYVFSRFPIQDRLRVMGLPSISSIVSFGGVPSPISQREIEMLKLLTGQDCPVMPWPFLRMGHRVRVRQGPLVGLEGVLVREKGAYRVVVKIEMLHRAVAVELERDLLQPLMRVGQTA
jgi:transcription antitermination factor NusG